MKYNKSKLNECVEYVKENGLMEYGGAMLKDFCKAMDICDDTFYDWMNKPEFAEAIKAAKTHFKNGLERNIVASLAKAATGYEWEKRSTEYANVNGKPVIKKQSITTIHESCNVGASIFLLTNIAPDRWKNSQQHELTGEVSTGLHVVVENEEDKELIEKLGNLE